MKALAVLVLLALLGVCAVNWMQIRELRQDINALETKLKQERTGSVTDSTVAHAVNAIMEAKAAFDSANTIAARSALDLAGKKLSEAASTASRSAVPTVRWLQKQASELGAQVDKAVRGR